jgi:hypothetical protein
MECPASRRRGIFKNYTASKIRVISSLWHVYPDRPMNRKWLLTPAMAQCGKLLQSRCKFHNFPLNEFGKGWDVSGYEKHYNPAIIASNHFGNASFCQLHPESEDLNRPFSPTAANKYLPSSGSIAIDLMSHSMFIAKGNN